MSLTPPPPPPPHGPSSSGSFTGCRSSFSAGKPKNCPARSLAITPPLSRASSAHEGPIPSSLPDASRLREILADITHQTNNGYGLRRHATIAARPLAPRVRAPLGPVTRSRSLIALPTPSRSRSHTPSTGGVDENVPGTDSPAARLVLARATRTPTTTHEPGPFYTPSPLGHRPRTMTRIDPLRIGPGPPSEPDSSLPPSSSSEPRIPSRRRRRSVEPADEQPPTPVTSTPTTAIQPEPRLRRLRRLREDSTVAPVQGVAKRRKRNSSSSGLGRL